MRKRVGKKPEQVAPTTALPDRQAPREALLTQMGNQAALEWTARLQEEEGSATYDGGKALEEAMRQRVERQIGLSMADEESQGKQLGEEASAVPAAEPRPPAQAVPAVPAAEPRPPAQAVPAPPTATPAAPRPASQGERQGYRMFLPGGREPIFPAPAIASDRIRHHIIPVNDLKEIYNSILPGGEQYAKKYWGQIVKLLCDAVENWISVNVRTLKIPKGREASQASQAIQEIQEIRTRLMGGQGLDESQQDTLRQVFLWYPGNWVVGPAKRDNDPGDRFDTIAGEVFDQIHGTNGLHKSFHDKLTAAYRKKEKDQLAKTYLEFLKATQKYARNPTEPEAGFTKSAKAIWGKHLVK